MKGIKQLILSCMLGVGAVTPMPYASPAGTGICS